MQIMYQKFIEGKFIYQNIEVFLIAYVQIVRKKLNPNPCFKC